MILLLSFICIIGVIIGIIFLILKYIFVYLYGEQIRQILINMPEYQPTWFATVGLDKPIRFWHLVRINFFVIRLFGVVFTKQKSLINEEFKSQLSKKYN